MVIQLYAEVNDSVESMAEAAVHMVKVLRINVQFYYNRVSYYVRPGETAQEVINSINPINPQAKK